MKISEMCEHAANVAKDVCGPNFNSGKISLGGIYQNQSTGNPRIQVFRGISLLSESVGEQLITEKSDDPPEGYPYTASFVHFGVEFFQLGDTEEDAHE